MHVHLEHLESLPGESAAVFEAFRSDPEHWLPTDVRAAGPHRWRMDLHAGPVRHQAIVEIGPSGGIPDGVRRSIRWWAPNADHIPDHRAALFPSLAGHLTLRRHGRGVTLAIAGDYDPPGGVVGAMLDVTAGRRVARATVRWLAIEIAIGLGSGTSVAA